MWGNYDFVSQYISELGAIGSPSRAFTVSLGIVYGILVVIFALGVLRFAGQKRVLRIVGGLLTGYAIVGFMGFPFPMNPSEISTTLTNTMHQALAGVTVFLILLSLGFGATAFGEWFRYYTVGVILVYLILGALPFLSVVQFESGQPLPMVGLVQRIMVYGYMLWLAVLSTLLINTQKGQGIVNV